MPANEAIKKENSDLVNKIEENNKLELNLNNVEDNIKSIEYINLGKIDSSFSYTSSNALPIVLVDL